MKSAKVATRDTLSGGLRSVLLSWCLPEESRLNELHAKLLAELSAAYSEPHRRYHTVAHVEKCLNELAGAGDCAVRPEEVRFALLFHDAVYDPRRNDNEARSADWACSVMDELGRPEHEQARIREMILATAHAGEPRTPDESLVLDIDLSILGAGEPEFDDYDGVIRAEYAWVPEHEYRRVRARVLESFLGRPCIYRTRPYRERREQAARANIARALARLGSEHSTPGGVVASPLQFHKGRLFDHVHLRVADVDASKRFYRAVFAALGLPDIVHEGPGFFYADELYVDKADGHASRVHLAFQAAERKTVEAFYRAALAAGGKDNGPPAERSYHPGYYAAFVLDPDGNNIEAVFHGPFRRSAPSVLITAG